MNSAKLFLKKDHYWKQKTLSASLRRVKFFASSVLFLAIGATPALAEYSLTANPPIFVPAYSISDLELKDFAVAVGYVFALQNEDVYVSANSRLANFIFISQPDAIVDGRIQARALDIFDEPARQLLSSLDLDSDVCSALPIGFFNDRAAVLAVHNSNKTTIDVGKRCFLLGLAIFNDSTPKEIKEIQSLGIKSATIHVLNNFAEFDE